LDIDVSADKFYGFSRPYEVITGWSPDRSKTTGARRKQSINVNRRRRRKKITVTFNVYSEYKIQFT